jgi:hypothetical protein
MSRWLICSLVILGLAAPAGASGITGQYVEVRTCDIWTGPCFANAEVNLGGKHGVMAWRIDKGTFDNVKLDGLSVVAVVAASDTLGVKQTGPAKTVFIVDKKATSAQRAALIKLAQKQAAGLLKNVVAVQDAEIDLTLCDCEDGACAELKAGGAHLKTRCLNKEHDKACGNETAFYPPLADNVSVHPAAAIEHGYSGKGLNETWSEGDRRGAYVGSFSIK